MFLRPKESEADGFAREAVEWFQCEPTKTPIATDSINLCVADEAEIPSPQGIDPLQPFRQAEGAC